MKSKTDKAARKVLILHEIAIWVDVARGSSALDSKYAVYETDKNFIKVPYNDPNAVKYSFENGYRHLTSRVPVNDLMIVREPGYHDDSTDCVRRTIYCLDDDCEKAIYMIHEAVNKRIEEMKVEMDKLHSIWSKAKVNVEARGGIWSAVKASVKARG